MIKHKNKPLKRLAAELDFILRSEDGPSQCEIAEKAGVDQSLVSRAANGKLRRSTERVRRLGLVATHIYANIQKKTAATPDEIEAAVKGYLALGGDPNLLMLQLQVLQRAVSRPRRSEPASLDDTD